MNKLCPLEGWYRLPQPSCLSIPLPFFGLLGAQLQRSTLPSASGSDASVQRGALCGHCVAPAISFSESAAAFASDPGFQRLK